MENKTKKTEMVVSKDTPKEINKKGIFKVFNFGKEYVAPEYKYNATHGFIEWGRDNQYPQYLLDLYNHYGSTTHKSIINKKSRLTTGYGLKDIIDTQLQEYVKKNKLEKTLRKCEIDFEIYNGFCFEIVWNNEGSSFDIHYMPFNKIRKGIENDEIDYPHYWYSKNWKEYKKDEYEPKLLKKFDPSVKTGKQLYYYIEPNPQQDEIYPIPNYSTSINWIELDYEISKFHLNQVKQGFAPSFILNFATGIPTIEEMDEYYRDFKRNYEGAENSGKIIITYSEGQEQAPQLTPIQLNDSDERFIMLQDMVEKNIVMGHEIPPQLVVLTPGKLGSTQEREELLTEFQSYYITTRQEQLEEQFNEVLKVIGFTEDIKLKQYDEVTTDKTEDLGVQEKAQAELKGSVGGVQGILQIQQSVSQGITTIDSGAAILELIYGIEPATARRMLGEPIVVPPTDNTQIING
jgi:hypothetical protein